MNKMARSLSLEVTVVLTWYHWSIKRSQSWQPWRYFQHHGAQSLEGKPDWKANRAIATRWRDAPWLIIPCFDRIVRWVSSVLFQDLYAFGCNNSLWSLRQRQTMYATSGGKGFNSAADLPQLPRLPSAHCTMEGLGFTTKRKLFWTHSSLHCWVWSVTSISRLHISLSLQRLQYRASRPQEEAEVARCAVHVQTWPRLGSHGVTPNTFTNHRRL